MSYDKDTPKTPYDKKMDAKKFGDKKFGDKKFGDKKFGDKKFDDKNKSLDMHGSTPKAPTVKFDRIAKVMARAGLCSRRDAERWIADERVSVNGRLLTTPAVKVSDKDIIKVDGKLIKAPEATRLWKYYKPAGLVTSHGDPEGRPTVFSRLRQEGLPRVISVGRLDINTEGMLLITNNGALARHLEMPATGWQRKYRARAYGKITQHQLDTLKGGITIDGIRYGSILATLERQNGDNCWISLSLKEGKNREIKEVLGSFGLQVNRLIRISYGPFKLDNMERGTVEPITTQMLKDQLGSMYDEIDEGYDAELRPQDQVGYRIESKDRDSRGRGRDDRGRGDRDDKRSGGQRRDTRGGRSFGNDRDDRRGGAPNRDRDDSRGRSFNRDRDDKRNDGDTKFEKRPGRNNEKRSYGAKRSAAGEGNRERPRGGRDRDGNKRSDTGAYAGNRDGGGRDGARREGGRSFERNDRNDRSNSRNDRPNNRGGKSNDRGGRPSSGPRRGNRG